MCAAVVSGAASAAAVKLPEQTTPRACSARRPLWTPKRAAIRSIASAGSITAPILSLR